MNSVDSNLLKNRKTAFVLMFLRVVILVSLAIIIFGIRANAVYFAGGENGVNTFNWAFYVGLAGAVFSGIGSGCYLWGAYRIKRWEDKHYARIPIKD